MEDLCISHRRLPPFLQPGYLRNFRVLTGRRESIGWLLSLWSYYFFTPSVLWLDFDRCPLLLVSFYFGISDSTTFHVSDPRGPTVTSFPRVWSAGSFTTSEVGTPWVLCRSRARRREREERPLSDRVSIERSMVLDIPFSPASQCATSSVVTTVSSPGMWVIHTSLRSVLCLCRVKFHRFIIPNVKIFHLCHSLLISVLLVYGSLEVKII